MGFGVFLCPLPGSAGAGTFERAAPANGFPSRDSRGEVSPHRSDYFLTTLFAFAFGLAAAQMGNFGAICVHKLVLKARRSASSGT